MSARSTSSCTLTRAVPLPLPLHHQVDVKLYSTAQPKHDVPSFPPHGGGGGGKGGGGKGGGGGGGKGGGAPPPASNPAARARWLVATSMWTVVRWATANPTRNPDPNPNPNCLTALTPTPTPNRPTPDRPTPTPNHTPKPNQHRLCAHAGQTVG